MWLQPDGSTQIVGPPVAGLYESWCVSFSVTVTVTATQPGKTQVVNFSSRSNDFNGHYEGSEERK